MATSTIILRLFKCLSCGTEFVKGVSNISTTDPICPNCRTSSLVVSTNKCPHCGK